MRGEEKGCVKNAVTSLLCRSCAAFILKRANSSNVHSILCWVYNNFPKKLFLFNHKLLGPAVAQALYPTPGHFWMGPSTMICALFSLKASESYLICMLEQNRCHREQTRRAQSSCKASRGDISSDKEAQRHSASERYTLISTALCWSLIFSCLGTWEVFVCM